MAGDDKQVSHSQAESAGSSGSSGSSGPENPASHLVRLHFQKKDGKNGEGTRSCRLEQAKTDKLTFNLGTKDLLAFK